MAVTLISAALMKCYVKEIESFPPPNMSLLLVNEVGWGFISYFMNTLLTTLIIIATPAVLAHTHRCLCHLLLEKLYSCFAFRFQLVCLSQLD